MNDSGSTGHAPVLPTQVLSLFDPKPGMTCLDCTLGRGGHSAQILPKLAPNGRLIALDVDPANIDFCKPRLKHPEVHVDLIRANFASARAVLSKLGLDRVDLLLTDLGFSSTQMDDPARGFSFNRDGPLDMRLDPSLPQTAADLVNSLAPNELADLIYRYGEERLSRRIAGKIVEERRRSPILTTGRLAEVIRSSYGSAAGKSRIDPATRTFMALRIAVNAELDALERLLNDLPLILARGGVAAIISFHSLEDRLVKQRFAELRRTGEATVLTPKPLVADESEVTCNPRSRSAKLRALRLSPPSSSPRADDGSTSLSKSRHG